jgi:hypothetical protein
MKEMQEKTGKECKKTRFYVQSFAEKRRSNAPTSTIGEQQVPHSSGTRGVCAW